MADENKYILTMTGDDLKALLDILINAGITETELGYLIGASSNIQSQINNVSNSITTQIGTLTTLVNNHTQPASRVTAGTFGGKVSGGSSAESDLEASQFRNIKISTDEPTSEVGNNGDIWIVYDE